MEWDATLHEEPRYLEIVTRGVADGPGSARMAKAIQETMRSAHLTRVLIDHRAITAVEGSILELHDRPKTFHLLGVLLRIRIAELILPEHREHFRSFESFCTSRGFKVGIFYQRDAALTWLFE